MAALELEVSIIEALLRRHRTNHGRTIYYRRLQMVMQCCWRLDIVNFRKRVKQHQSKTSDEQQQQLMVEDENFNQIKYCLLGGFEELVSRIEHASKAFFIEISRGFFLPLCTVAMAAMARVRVLTRNLIQEASTIQILKGEDGSRLQQIVTSMIRDQEELEGSSSFKSKRISSLNLLKRSLGIPSKMKTCQQETDDKMTDDEEEQNTEDDTEIIDSSTHDTTEGKAHGVAAPLVEDLGAPIVTESSQYLETSSGSIDRNMDMVRAAKLGTGVFKSKQPMNSTNSSEFADLKVKSPQGSKEKRDNKRKHHASDNATDTKKKTKKKKKKKKKDVMDEIFGDL